jgi:hypothetical protein
MRRLMLALSIASFIATPVVFAHGQHQVASHSGSHRAHARDQAAARSSHTDGRTGSGTDFDASDRSQALADTGRGRHHGSQPRTPDEEELAQPEQ